MVQIARLLAGAEVGRLTAPFSKLLVANRGEIAMRVFRTCSQHGIGTVAVYSEGDRRAPHAAAADEAVCIGPTPATESYLRADRVIDAALKSGAQAIHPGYGFLSEQAEFVRACDAAGIVFVGPPASAMEIMGDKVRARAAMIAAGVPVIPGVEDLSSHRDAILHAKEIGFPVMLKASAGGGGKGMRVVREPAELERAFDAAVREAEAAFGDGRLFMERAVLSARHVEFQVMADAHGNVTHLGERDCSVQRRHQKVIEESPCPSPQMNEEVRSAMGEVAVRVARAVDYRSAGTVEFLFEETDAGPRFYFLEMNTRLQVEHPVTEATTGRDLVWDQIRVAAGQPLGYGQRDVERRGHAIECRVYAEDPVRFLPRPGRITGLRWPEGAQVRVDSAVRAGTEVSSHYDPLIAKVTTWGLDREEAMARMRQAMHGTAVLGIETNIPLHLRILDEPDFMSGAKVTTSYIADHPELVSELESDGLFEERMGTAVAAAAAVSAARAIERGGRQADGGSPGDSAWRRSARWRS
jgi:acetyl-CoA carboxylase biotin carboxylase subunit